VSNWYGPRSNPDAIDHGACGCCGCLAEEGHFAGTQGDQRNYPAFLDGGQARLTLAGFPGSVFALQVMPTTFIGSFGTDKIWPWREYTYTGFNELNGTYLIDLPLSQYGCIMKKEEFTVASFNVTCDVEIYHWRKNSYVGDDCTGAFLENPSSWSITIPVTITMGMTRWPGSPLKSFRSIFWEITLNPGNWCELQSNLQHFKYFRAKSDDPNRDVLSPNSASFAMDAAAVSTGITGDIEWTGNGLGVAPCPPIIPEPARDWVPDRAHETCPSGYTGLHSYIDEVMGNVATYDMELVRP